MLKDKGIQRIDLVCADLIDIKVSFKSVKQLRRAMSLERVKINLLMAAGEGGKIPICDPYDRKLFADWLNEGTGDIGRHCETKKRKKRKSRYSKTLRLMAAFALSLSREMMSVGTICDHLRE
jgi:hypothetical protein